MRRVRSSSRPCKSDRSSAVSSSRRPRGDGLMPWFAACCRITALSQSFSGKPARRAASSAFLRASGRTPLTLHAKPNFMLAPTSEVETPRAGSTPVAGARVNRAWIRGSVLRPPSTVSGDRKQVVNVFRSPDLGDSPAVDRHRIAAVIFSGRNTRMLPPSDLARLGFVRFGGGRGDMDSEHRAHTYDGMDAAGGGSTETPADLRNAGTCTIGELARDAGVTLRALRFYQSKGLLTPRRNGSARLFSHEDRDRLALILQGKRLGFTLTEIREMLAARARGCTKALPIGRRKCVEQINMLERQRRDIEAALAELRQVYHEMIVASDLGPLAKIISGTR